MRNLIILLLLFMATSCYYDSEEYLFPVIDSVCDTANVSYINDIQPVLSGYCYRCHDNAGAALYGGNIALEDYPDVKIRINDGSLIGSITHQGSFSPMPKGGGRLDNCTQLLFTTWSGLGAPDN